MQGISVMDGALFLRYANIVSQLRVNTGTCKVISGIAHQAKRLIK